MSRQQPPPHSGTSGGAHTPDAAGSGPHNRNAPFAVTLDASQTGAVRLALSGRLTVQEVGKAQKALSRALADQKGAVEFYLEGLTAMDTNGALLLNGLAASLEREGRACRFTGAGERYEHLLAKASPAAEQEQTAGAPAPWPIRICNDIGKGCYEGLEAIGQLVGFLGRFLAIAGRLLLSPGKMRWTSLVFHMEQTGLRAAPIVALLTFLIGLVVAYMGAQQLMMFGAQVFAVNLLEVTVMREMAVLITSIVVAGRSSSSFTAQIGAMVANEEVAALRSMGLDPMVLLVVPRVIALVLCLPMLVLLADVMSLFGGAVAIWYIMDMDLASFLTQLRDVARLNNFLVGMFKTPFFAVAIGLVGCFQGFRATSSAESVGFLTTVAVVQSIFLVILLDALFAVFFTSIGV